MKRLQGIAGLNKRDPYSVLVRAGHKTQPRGAVRDNDRYFILSRSFIKLKSPMAGGYAAYMHPLDDRFKLFNEGKPESQMSLSGNLIFSTRKECELAGLAARELPNRGGSTPEGGGVYGKPKNGDLACFGDGKTAQRFNGDDANGSPTYITIRCPDMKCIFRRLGEAKVCGPLSVLKFLLRWPQGSPYHNVEGATVYAKFQAWSWDTVEELAGFFSHVDEQAARYGLNPGEWSWYGLPFTMALSMHVRPHKEVINYRGEKTRGTRNPVSTFSPGDLPQFFEFARERHQHQLANPSSVALLTAGEDATAAEVGEALAMLTPGSDLPAEVAVPPDLQPEAPEVVDAEVVEEAPSASRPLAAARLELRKLRERAGLTKAQVVRFAGLHGVTNAATDWNVETVSRIAGRIADELAAVDGEESPIGPADRAVELATSCHLSGDRLSEITRKIAGCEPPDLPLVFLDAVFQAIEEAAA